MTWAQIILAGGPFDGHEAAIVPPDTAAPIQICWSGWSPHGFDAWLYQWSGERTLNTLIFRPTGRHLTPDEMPPLIAEDAETWADAAAMIVGAFDVPPCLIWPGL